MDERLAALDRRVAEAADAWAADCLDTGVYSRLIAAILARRAYLNPLLELGQTPQNPTPVPERLQDDEVLDEVGAPDPRPVGDDLTGNVKDVLEALRAERS